MPTSAGSAMLNFESDCLYDHLGCSKDVSLAEIRKTYYKLALQYHPDRNSGCTTKEFQMIGRAYEILGDESKRCLYDETGVIDGDGLLDGSNVNFEAYFRELFQQVRLEDIEAFKATYQGSVEEYEDVLVAYRKHKGSIEAIVDDIFFGDEEGSLDRFMAIIKRAIEKGILTEEKSFSKIISDDAALKSLKNRRKRTAAKEAKEAGALAKELGIGKDGNLHAVIKGKQQGRFDAMIAGMEAKYGGGQASKTKSSSKKQRKI